MLLKEIQVCGGWGGNEHQLCQCSSNENKFLRTVSVILGTIKLQLIKEQFLNSAENSNCCKLISLIVIPKTEHVSDFCLNVSNKVNREGCMETGSV